MKYTGTDLLAKAPVGKAIFHLALPMIAAMLAQSIYNLFDIFFVGKTGDTNMITAISLVFPILLLAQAIGLVFAIGGASYISRLFGLKNEKEAQKTSSVCFYFSIVSNLFISLFLLVFKQKIFNMLGVSDTALHYTERYYTLMVLFIPFAVTSVVLSSLMRSEGATDKAMRLIIYGLFTTIILDPILILGFKLDTLGAAISSSTGQIVSFLYGISYFTSLPSLRGTKQSIPSPKTKLSLDIKNVLPNKLLLKEVFFIGFPAGLTNFFSGIATIFSNRIATNYGDDVVAASNLQLRIATICFTLVFAMTMGYQPFAGFNFSAKNFERLKAGFKYILVSTTALCIVSSIVFYVFASSLIRFFIDDEQTIHTGTIMLHAFAIGLIFFGIQDTIMTTFQAIGKPFPAMIISISRQVIFYIPFLFIFSRFWSFNGFIFAFPAADICTTILAISLSYPLYKIFKRA